MSKKNNVKRNKFSYREASKEILLSIKRLYSDVDYNDLVSTLRECKRLVPYLRARLLTDRFKDELNTNPDILTGQDFLDIAERILNYNGVKFHRAMYGDMEYSIIITYLSLYTYVIMSVYWECESLVDINELSEDIYNNLFDSK